VLATPCGVLLSSIRGLTSHGNLTWPLVNQSLRWTSSACAKRRDAGKHPHRSVYTRGMSVGTGSSCPLAPGPREGAPALRGRIESAPMIQSYIIQRGDEMANKDAHDVNRCAKSVVITDTQRRRDPNVVLLCCLTRVQLSSTSWQVRTYLVLPMIGIIECLRFQASNPSEWCAVAASGPRRPGSKRQENRF
jgi:hypothetical protein